jgi:outer membrane lipoprotein SlyB
MRKLLPLLLLLTACAEDPIVDMRGVDERQYQNDLAECRDYAAQVNTGKEAVKHGAAGAAVGAVVGAVIGDHRTAERVAGVGAVTGSSKGISRAEKRKQTVIFNCLRGRGYKILG